jgi:hypothetical protein
MLAGEDVPRAAHVGGELIDFVDILDDGAGENLVAQVTEDEFVGVSRTVLMLFDVDATNSEAFRFQTFYEVAADKATSAIHENAFCHSCS